MSYGRRVWTLYEDPDLKLIHAERNCRDARVAVKYNTIVSRSVTEGDQGRAKELFSAASPCPSCTLRLSRRPAGHPRPPGFRKTTGEPRP